MARTFRIRNNNAKRKRHGTKVGRGMKPIDIQIFELRSRLTKAPNAEQAKLREQILALEIQRQKLKPKRQFD